MIRFGVIGTNWITDEFIRCAKITKNFKLNAVYSRTKEKAVKFAEKYSVEGIFTDLESMAKSDSIDAVYIASPNSCHAYQAKLFLEKKKHVLCEKPICSNLLELEQMIKAAKENKVLLMEAMKSSFLPNFKTIKENLYKIGKIRRYFANYCQYSSRYDRYKSGKNPNTFNPEFSNGSLMDIGVYCIHPLIHLFGKPNSICARGVILESGVDGEGSLILTYDDMDAIIIHSKIANSALPSEIQGEEGNIIIDKIHTPESIKILYKNGEEEDITVPQSKDNMYYEAKEFIDLIKAGKTESSVNSYTISRSAMEVLEKARKQMGVIYPADKWNNK
ncbi:Gfo/Idh/MocA family protein [Maledivibacter halophilus]|uniref:Predicted dehydrogenase n=1 Tax=Maledivibacter halophilus TaxID=36842 RepID=A0A1T5KJU0_9FIRM|nr:Gfo/Idh/MocA family oxidoreductase [Maledivibacter halophilus]SKC63719.1 Predicted dehydrogenase [Maledivibacter halophilus]